MAILEINFRPSEKELRWFGVLLLIFFALVAALVLWRTGSLTAAKILLAIGSGLCLIYYAARPLRRPLFMGWMAAVYPIGWTISHLIFASIYYLVLTPTGLFLRLFGYDPMQRDSRLAKRSSFWVERRRAEDASRYFRQF